MTSIVQCRCVAVFAALVGSAAMACSSGGTNGGDPDAGPAPTESGVPEKDGGDRADAATDAAAPCVEGASDRQTDPRNCGRCGRDCGGGACSAGACQPFALVSGQENTYGVAVSGNKVYFTMRPSNRYNGDLRVVATTGGAVTTLESDINGLRAVLSDGTTLYYGARESVWKRAVANGPPTKIADAPLNHDVEGLALDGNFLYYATGAFGAVRRVNVTDNSATDVVSAAQGPRGIAIRAGKLYIADGDAYKIRILDLASSNETAIEGTPFISAVGLDGSDIWYTQKGLATGAGGVFVRKADGSGAPKKLLPDDPYCEGIAVTTDAVYWADSPSGRIMKLVR